MLVHSVLKLDDASDNYSRNQKTLNDINGAALNRCKLLDQMGICVTDAVAGDNYNYLQEENCVKGTLFKNKECKDDCKNKP